MASFGQVIAEGRDTEILDHGPGLVLRRPRVPRSLAGEAQVMEWVRAQGYPCPAVVEVVDDGMIMERIEGRSMLDELMAHPWRLRSQATLLADLHGWLHRLVVPVELRGLLPQPYGPGPTPLHLDLHPGNVMLGPQGPVVIDWSNAAVGPGAVDVAEAWLLMAAAGLPGSAIDRVTTAVFRPLLVRAFLHDTDRAAAAQWLPAVLARRRHDPNLSEQELSGMARVVDRAVAAG